jgi:GNAT superfamily N-acetyltransferase
MTTYAQATPADAAAIAAMQCAVADDLTARHGRGHWSTRATERGVLQRLQQSLVLVARTHVEIVGAVVLAAKKPWAIDVAYFREVTRPLYLTDMVVRPSAQRQGVGRGLVERVLAAAREWPAGAIRLDAYDSAAGAGEFYRKCDFTEVARVTYRRVPLIYFERLL